MMAFNSERESLRKQLFPKPLPTFEPKLKQRPNMYKTHNYWFLPSDLADDDIVNRTQRYFYETQQYKRPAQFKSYIGVPTRLEAFLVYIMLYVGYYMAMYSGTRKFMLKHPKIFSAGFVSRDGVPDEIMNSIKFECVLRGTGWDETVKDTNSTKPNKTVVAKVSGVNPGYAFTAVTTLNCALTILREQYNMPGKGGVLTTGMAFSKTSLVKKIHENDYKFEIVYE